MKKAMFGAGCFWGVEYNFSKLEGVSEVVSGYEVKLRIHMNKCADSTEHAEVVMIDYDETVISYEDLLDSFWKKHDPTTLNRQGPDVGNQYRSAIFYYDEEQKELAQKSLDEFQKKLNKKIVTEPTKVDTFGRLRNMSEILEKHNIRH